MVRSRAFGHASALGAAPLAARLMFALNLLLVLFSVNVNGALVAKAVRLSGSMALRGMSVIEVEAWTTGGVNVARLASTVVTVSSGGSPNYLVDGTTRLVWVVPTQQSGACGYGRAPTTWDSNEEDNQPWAIVTLRTPVALASVSIWLWTGYIYQEGYVLELLDAAGGVVYSAMLTQSSDVSDYRRGSIEWIVQLPDITPSPTRLWSPSPMLSRTATASPEPSPGACSPGWFLPPGSDFCYRAFDTQLTWAGAQDFCRAQGGGGISAGLASVRSPAEADFVVGDRCGALNGEVWVGLNDLSVDARNDRTGPWQWASGASSAFITSPAGQALWATDQPSDSTSDSRSCVLVSGTRVTGGNLQRSRYESWAHMFLEPSTSGACCETPRLPLPARTSPMPTPSPYSCIAYDFESSLLAPYSGSPSALVSVVATSIRISGITPEILRPLAGNYMARLLSGAGAGIYTVMSLAVDAAAGASIQFDVRFDAGDTQAPYNDDAAVTHVYVAGPPGATYVNTTLLALDVLSVGSLGLSPWLRGAYTLAQPGRHTLTFSVRNIGDNRHPSQLLVDNARICPLPPTPPPTPSKSSSPIARPSPGACPTGWALAPGSDYCFALLDGTLGAKMTVDEANSICRLNAGVASASLASIRNQAEADFLVSMLPFDSDYRMDAMTGLYSAINGMPWMWTSGISTSFITSPAGLALWLFGEPSGSVGTCVFLARNRNGKVGLVGRACNSEQNYKSRFLCEALRAPLARPLTTLCATSDVSTRAGRVAAVGMGLAGNTNRLIMMNDSYWQFPFYSDSWSCPGPGCTNSYLVVINFGTPLPAGSRLWLKQVTYGGDDTYVFAYGVACPSNSGQYSPQSFRRVTSCGTLDNVIDIAGALVGKSALIVMAPSYAPFQVSWHVELPCDGRLAVAGFGTTGRVSLLPDPKTIEVKSPSCGALSIVGSVPMALVMLDFGAPLPLGANVTIRACPPTRARTSLWVGTSCPQHAASFARFGCVAANDYSTSTPTCSSEVVLRVSRGGILEDRRFLYVLVGPVDTDSALFNASVTWSASMPPAATPAPVLVAQGSVDTDGEQQPFVQQAIGAKFHKIVDVSSDVCGNTYLSENRVSVYKLEGQSVRRISPLGVIEVIYTADVQPEHYQKYFSNGGDLIVAGDNKLQRVTPGGSLLLIAGSARGEAGYSGDGGPATAALLSYPRHVVSSSALGLIFFDGFDRIRRVSAAGIISTIAGGGSASIGSSYLNGMRPSDIDFRGFEDLTANDAGIVFVATESVLFSFAPLVAGSRVRVLYGGLNGCSDFSPRDGELAMGACSSIIGNSIVADSAGSLFFVEYSLRNTGDALRRIAANGMLTTVSSLFYGGLDTKLAIDGTGGLIVLESNETRVRIIRIPGVATPSTATCTQPPTRAEFTFTNAPQLFTVPAGVTRLVVHAWGGGGGGTTMSSRPGGRGGGGAYVNGSIAVTPGETLVVTPGRGGSVPAGAHGTAVQGGGGGGVPSKVQGDLYGGGGGGATVVARASGATLLVAGGGGGGGGYAASGGAGGMNQGRRGGDGAVSSAVYQVPTGTDTKATAGGGGSTTAGGAGSFPGASGRPLSGGDCTFGTRNQCGGGGGGYRGGGAGDDGGGGGGSSWTGGLAQTGGAAGAGWAPGGNRSAFYAAGAGVGGALRTAGGHGRVVLVLPPGVWLATPSSRPPPSSTPSRSPSRSRSPTPSRTRKAKA